MLKQLPGDAGADVNAADMTTGSVESEYVSPLMVAVKKNKVELVEVMISAKADVNHMDNDTKTVLDYDPKNVSHEIVKLLREASAEKVEKVK